MSKAPLGLIITLIILAIVIIALGLSLLTQNTPLDKVVGKYERNYKDSLFSIQYLAGENALALSQQINTFCPGFGLEEYYLAQFDNPAQQKSIIFVINPVTGSTECVIDRSTDINTSRASLAQNLMAIINDEPVYTQEVMAVYNNIPENLRTNTSLQESLDQVINNKLLLQDAANKGLSVAEADVDNSINAFLANSGLTLQQVEQNLANAGSSINEFRNNIRNSLLLQTAINDATLGVEQPSEAELKTYYDANRQSFVTPAKAIVRQLLIFANQSNQASRLEIIKAISQQYNGTNFCELIEKYSKDAQSVGRCGLYSFEQGQLLPEFEEVVFSLEPGTTQILQTRLGYHLVQIIDVTLPEQLSFEQAKESIINYFVLVKKQEVLNQYIQNLRQKADIVSYVD